jgi:hypothetical protein
MGLLTQSGRIGVRNNPTQAKRRLEWVHPVLCG